MKPLDESPGRRYVLINLAISSLVAVVLLPDTALAHGEQVGTFFTSFGLFILLSSIVIVFVKIKWKLKGLFFSLYAFILAILVLTPGTRFLPVSHPVARFIERLIWSYPVATSFMSNLLGLVPLLIFLIHKRAGKKKVSRL